MPSVWKVARVPVGLLLLIRQSTTNSAAVAGVDSDGVIVDAMPGAAVVAGVAAAAGDGAVDDGAVAVVPRVEVLT